MNDLTIFIGCPQSATETAELLSRSEVRLEIAVNDEYVDNAVDSIIKVAQGAKDKGRGKIFILPIEECIRLRTNERGKEAIG